MAQPTTYHTDVYQQRNPKASAYYKCVENHFEQLERAWDDGCFLGNSSFSVAPKFMVTDLSRVFQHEVGISATMIRQNWDPRISLNWLTTIQTPRFRLLTTIADIFI